MSGGYISNEDIERVREASDLVSIVGERSPIKPRGRDLWCCCPLHHEKTPSFKIDPVAQLWHCFGCGEGGDVFGFLMKLEDLTFPEAVQRLADRAHIDITYVGGQAISTSKKGRLRDVCFEAASFFHSQLMRGNGPSFDEARAYLGKRGFGGSTPKRFMLGYAPGNGTLVNHLSAKGYTADEMIEANVATRNNQGRLRDRFFNRVMFPIQDEQGNFIAFGGRVIGEGEPKYLNSQDTPIFHKSTVLYALDKAKDTMASTGVALVVEGYTDVIALHEAGITNAVATLGTALTARHIRMLKRHAQHRIVYVFDGDSAGQRAADRALQFLDQTSTPEAGKAMVDLRAVVLPDNLDPAEFVASHGAAELKALIDTAKPLIEFGIDHRLARYDLDTPAGRAQGAASALSVLAPIKDSLLAKDYAIYIAGKLRMREEDLLEELARLSVAGRPLYDQDDNSPADPTSKPAHKVKLSASELNRLRCERDFISLCATNTADALTYASTLANTAWHELVHQKLADLILETLAQDINATPTAIVEAAASVHPKAPSILTNTLGMTEQERKQRITYLADELYLGDTEDAIADLKQRLNAESHSDEEFDMLYNTLIALQTDVSTRKRTRKPLAFS